MVKPTITVIAIATMPKRSGASIRVMKRLLANRKTTLNA